jgi:hypothetical protein
MHELGFEYDVEIQSWTTGFRTFCYKPNELLDGGLGLGLGIITQIEEGEAWLATISAELQAITTPFAEHQYQ